MSRPKNPGLHLSFELFRDGKILAPPIGLMLRGPVLEVSIAQHEKLVDKLKDEDLPIANPVVGRALLDTGATVTTIDSNAAKSLGLRQSGEVESVGIGGKAKGFRAACTVNIRGLPVSIPRAPCHDLSQVKLVAIIGRDILRHMVMTYNGPEGTVSLELVLPKGAVVKQTLNRPRQRSKGRKKNRR